MFIPSFIHNFTKVLLPCIQTTVFETVTFGFYKVPVRKPSGQAAAHSFALGVFGMQVRDEIHGEAAFKSDNHVVCRSVQIFASGVLYLFIDPKNSELFIVKCLLSESQVLTSLCFFDPKACVPWRLCT